MIRGKVVVYEKIGSEQILHISLDEDNIIRVRSDPTKINSFGEEVYVKIDWSKTLLFDPKTNELLI